MDDAHEDHTVHLVVYHLIWCPKRRRTVLVGPSRTRLEPIVRAGAAENDCTVIERAIQPDQVHRLVRADPHPLPSDIPRRLTGRSAPQRRQDLPPLRTLPSRWTRSFLLSTAGNVSHETMRPSLERQSQTSMDAHPGRTTFQYQLTPTLWQEQALEVVVRRCRERYHAAREA